MEYSAVGLAVIGAAAGIAFRWKVLLPIIIVVPFATLAFSIPRGLGLRDTAIIVIVAEAVLQGGYCVGLLIRLAATARWTSSLFKGRRTPGATETEQRTAPPAGAGKGP